MTKIINALYFLFLIPLLFMFSSNVFTIDLTTHERIISNFNFLYISILSLTLITIFKYKIYDKKLFILLFGYYVLILYSTTYNAHMSVSNQLSLKKLLQLGSIFIFSYFAYIAGRTFPLNNKKMISYFSYSILIFIFIAILHTIGAEYLYVKRPFAWSFYYLVFFTAWFLYIDTSKIRPYILSTIVFMAIVSGSRSALIMIGLMLLSKLKLKYFIIGFIFLPLLYFYIIDIDFENIRFVSHGMQTNRTEVWEKVLSVIKTYNHLWFGNGAYFFDFNINKIESITVPHNTLLMLQMYGGFAGVAFGLLIIGYVVSKLYKDYIGFALAIPIVMIVNDLPLFPGSFSRIFENIILYFIIGILIQKSINKKRKGSI